MKTHTQTQAKDKKKNNDNEKEIHKILTQQWMWYPSINKVPEIAILFFGCQVCAAHFFETQGHRVIQEFLENYNPDVWGANGPRLLGRIYEQGLVNNSFRYKTLPS